MVTILIADDHALFREGLRHIIEGWDDFEIVGEASNGEEVLRLAREMVPDIILMDISMPVLNGIETTMRLSVELPSVCIVMLTTSEDEEDVLKAIKNGATGYLVKNTPSRRLHDELRGVMRGESPISSTVATKIMREFHQEKPRPLMEPLSEREEEVLRLLVEGLTNSEIGEKLFISSNTVKKHLSNILNKLHLNNRVEAVVYAIREGLVDLED